MARPRAGVTGPTSPFPIDPGSLPDDGSTVTFEQSFAKRLNANTGMQSTLSEEDFTHAEWLVERLGSDGWAAIDKVRGRPYKPQLRELHGEGKYRVTPLDKQGKPVEEFHKVELIGNPVVQLRPGTQQQDNTPAGSDDMPVWLRYQMQQQAEERREERARQQRAEERREEWERQQAEKENARLEREERREEARAAREAEDRRQAAERNANLINAGLALAGQIVSARAQPVERAAREDSPTTQLLLEHVLTDRQRRAENPSPAGSLKETLDLLLVLDTLAQRRAEAMPGSQPEREEEDLGTTMMKMLPSIISARTGGSAQPAADPRAMAEEIISKAMRDPAMLAQIAAKDPEGTARVFRQAIKQDKRLESAVIKVLEEEDDEE